MISYSQRDPRWASKPLGASKLTIGRYGCTTSCIADISTYFEDNLNPLQVSQKIKYTKDGLILWQTCVFPKFRFERREYGRNNKNIRAALNDPSRAVLLEVANGSHWVVATSVYGSDYKIADPWNGDTAISNRYNNITGAAYFKMN